MNQIEIEISEMLTLRELELQKYYSSYNEIEDKYTLDFPNSVNVYDRLIISELKESFDKISIDFIIETLNHLGNSVNLVYDDNGHYSLCSDGYQTISDDIQAQTIISFVEKEEWKDNIKEAVLRYLTSFKSIVDNNSL